MVSERSEVSWKDSLTTRNKVKFSSVSLTSSESLVCSCNKKEGRGNYAL